MNCLVLGCSNKKINDVSLMYSTIESNSKIDLTTLVNNPDGYDIFVKNSNVDFNTPGKYNITYLISIDGKSKEQTFEISVEDCEPPIIQETNDVIIGLNQTYTPEQFITTTDNCDSSPKIEVLSNNIDNTKYGKYKIEFQATDSSGNSSTKIVDIEVATIFPEGRIELCEYKNIKIRKYAHDSKEERDEAISTIYDYIISNSYFELNNQELNNEYNELYNDYLEVCNNNSISISYFASMNGYTLSEFKNHVMNTAEYNLKLRLISQAIIQCENFTLEQSDYNVLSDMYDATYEDLLIDFGESAVDESAFFYKVIFFLLDNAIEC